MTLQIQYVRINCHFRWDDDGIIPSSLEKKMPNIVVVEGCATAIKAEALVATISPSGWWIGGLHDEIRRSSGNLFHATAEAAMPLQKGQVVFAPALITHGGCFASVIFVVEDQTMSVYEVMTLAFKAANNYRIKSVSVPTFNADIDDLVQLAQAIADFRSKSSTLEEITVVVSNENDKYVLEDELWLV